MIGLGAGTALLLGAPGQDLRYHGLARAHGLLGNVLDRGALGDLRVVGMFFLYTVGAWALLGATVVAARRRPGAVWRRDVAALVAAALAIVLTLLASPKQGPRLYYASAVLLIVAVAIEVEVGVVGRRVRMLGVAVAAAVAVGGAAQLVRDPARRRGRRRRPGRPPARRRAGRDRGGAAVPPLLPGLVDLRRRLPVGAATRARRPGRVRPRRRLPRDRRPAHPRRRRRHPRPRRRPRPAGAGAGPGDRRSRRPWLLRPDLHRRGPRPRRPPLHRRGRRPPRGARPPPDPGPAPRRRPRRRPAARPPAPLRVVAGWPAPRSRGPPRRRRLPGAGRRLAARRRPRPTSSAPAPARPRRRRAPPVARSASPRATTGPAATCWSRAILDACHVVAADRAR